MSYYLHHGKQGLADPTGRISNDAPGLQIALALGASIYLLTDKKRVPRGSLLFLSIFPSVLQCMSANVLFNVCAYAYKCIPGAPLTTDSPWLHPQARQLASHWQECCLVCSLAVGCRAGFG